MQDVTVPGWALLAAGFVFIPWLIWLTLRSITSEKESAVRSAKVDGIPSELEKIYKQIQDGDKRIDDRFSEINRKFDMFIHQEMTLLKQIVKSEG